MTRKNPVVMRLGLLTVVMAMVGACGLRSVPLVGSPGTGGDGDGDGDSDSAGTDGTDDPTDDPVEDPVNQGSCEMPLSLSITEGRLAGPSTSEGECGNDGGPEAVRLFIPTGDVDVSITVRGDETDFTPTLRVQRDLCEPGAGETLVCSSGADRTHHFFAQGEMNYYVFLDSPEGASGEFAFDVDFAPLDMDRCAVHPEVIEQEIGSSFLWRNELEEGQGRTVGACGGAGRENMFQMEVFEPGIFFAEVNGIGAVDPILSFRSGCGGLTEIDCSTSEDATAATTLFAFVEEPGTYFLVIDKLSTVGTGEYELTVEWQAP